MANSITAKVEYRLKPFSTPNYVVIESVAGLIPANSSGAGDLPLSALDEYTLERMCDEFRDAVFKKAGKCRPPQAAHQHDQQEKK